MRLLPTPVFRLTRGNGMIVFMRLQFVARVPDTVSPMFTLRPDATRGRLRGLAPPASDRDRVRSRSSPPGVSSQRVRLTRGSVSRASTGGAGRDRSNSRESPETLVFTANHAGAEKNRPEVARRRTRTA